MTFEAWAVVGKKSGRILKNLRGHYAIYTHREDAVKDTPTYGCVRRISMRVQSEAAECVASCSNWRAAR